ncbi:MAG: AAA family ATPase [Nitrospirales bacterium]
MSAASHISHPSAVHELKTLVLSFHPVIAIETTEEDRLAPILERVAGDLQLLYFEWSITKGLVRPPQPSPVARTFEPLVLLKHLEGLTAQGLFLLKDFARYFEDPKVTRQFREVTQAFAATRSTLVLTGATLSLPKEVEVEAARFHLAWPSREELLQVTTSVLRSLNTARKTTARLLEEDQDELVRALQGLTLNQARQVVAGAMLDDGKLTREDIRRLLKRKAKLLTDGGLLEYYPVEDNRFELGGFGNLHAWLQRARLGFTAEAQALNLTPPRGILLVGVPGCGKSLSAKVIAREWRLPLLKLDMGRLYDKYIGETEKNLRQAIALAESMAPAVLWMDEIEKGLVAKGNSEADAGVSRRLFGTFLTWLQEKRKDVFVVATANDLSSLPPELLRKGRFDEVFFVDLPDSREREAILRIHLGLRKQDPEKLDLARLVEATDGFSGAEIEQAVIAALYRALHQKQPLGSEHLLAEIRQTVPLSVSRREEIAALREFARDRFVPVR